MANTLTNLIPIIYEGLDVVAREMIGAIPAVTRDSSLERVSTGQTVRSPVAPAVTASDIVPAVTPPNDGDQTFGYFDIKISNAKRVPIRWNGEEQLGLQNGNNVGYQAMVRDQWSQAFRTLANLVEQDILLQLRLAASRAIGTPGTTPFGIAGDFSDFANAHVVLDDNGAPMLDRQMLLGSAAMANIRGKQSVLFKANEAGTDQLLREGIVGRVEGFDLHLSPQMRGVTKGTGASFTLAAAAAAGATSLSLGAGTGTVIPGDVISLAGDPNNYVVVGPVGGISGPGTVQIGTPGLRMAAASGAAVSLSANFVPNIAFAKSAGRLVTRAPALPRDMSGSARDMATDRITVTDPVSGISFEIAEYLQYRQVQYEVSLVWGFNVTKPDFVTILRG